MSDNEDIIKVEDSEVVEWIGRLSDSERVELKRRALERRAVELLQPKPEAPNFGAMSDQDFERYKANNGFK